MVAKSSDDEKLSDVERQAKIEDIEKRLAEVGKECIAAIAQSIADRKERHKTEAWAAKERLWEEEAIIAKGDKLKGKAREHNKRLVAAIMESRRVLSEREQYEKEMEKTIEVQAIDPRVAAVAAEMKTLKAAKAFLMGTAGAPPGTAL